MASYHRCQNCGYETDIGGALTAFEENPHCRQCGLSVAESDSKMYSDLAGMMNSHLTLVQPEQDRSMPATPQVSPQPAPIAYITQHYHHSAHQAPSTEKSVSEILGKAGVNATALLPSQISLFKNADDEQKQRLVELWRISPPTPGNQLPPSVNTNWPQTSMDQEEEAARLRWETMERERLKSLCVLPGYDSRASAEPYMANLYHSSNVMPTKQKSSSSDEEEYKRCKDPVYNHSREWWQVGMDAEPMEHQYGLLQHMMWGQNDLYSSKKGDDDHEML